jgi:uncharacterized protein (TIGR04255 family)
MGFPESSRVLYKKNPIQEVTCQLRFPPILKIEVEKPVAFQDRVRSVFPFYQLRLVRNLLPDIVALIPFANAQLPFGAGTPAHEFASQDQNWTLALTRDSITLSCRRYERWEHFKQRLQNPLDGLTELYAPAFFSRVGLRYQDVFRRSILGLNDADWSELLQPWICGVLGPEALTLDEVEQSRSELLIRLCDKQSRVRVLHGLAFEPGSGEPCYLIDSDYFNEQQTEKSDAFTKLDFLNTQARLFFHWCIKPRLHEAMGPQPIAGV